MDRTKPKDQTTCRHFWNFNSAENMWECFFSDEELAQLYESKYLPE